jgi:mono/diheme cytochrome c family protein
MERLLTSVAIFSTLLPGAAFCQTGGRDLYIARCSACHAPDGSGSNTIGRSLKLSDIRPSIKSMKDEQLRQIMLEGKGKMPPNKKFDDEKVRSLTLFLRDLAVGNPDAGQAVREAQAQPLPNVDQIFQNKCSACHAPDGTGRTTIGKSLKIPDLTSAVVQSQNDEELTVIISQGKGRMPGYAKAFNPVQVGQFVSHIRALTKSGDVRAPIEAAKSPEPPPKPAPSLPTQITAQPESTPLSPNSASTTISRKLPAAEDRKIAEAKETTAPTAAKAPKSGRQIYIAKCSACHSSDGSGTGTIGRSMRIPSLTLPEVQGQSDESMASVISNGVGKMPAYKKKYNPEQIQLLVVYIRELGKKH